MPISEHTIFFAVSYLQGDNLLCVINAKIRMLLFYATHSTSLLLGRVTLNVFVASNCDTCLTSQHSGGKDKMIFIDFKGMLAY